MGVRFAPLNTDLPGRGKRVVVIRFTHSVKLALFIFLHPSCLSVYCPLFLEVILCIVGDECPQRQPKVVLTRKFPRM